jgi:hypothetical protein
MTNENKVRESPHAKICGKLNPKIELDINSIRGETN